MSSTGLFLNLLGSSFASFWEEEELSQLQFFIFGNRLAMGVRTGQCCQVLAFVTHNESRNKNFVRQKLLLELNHEIQVPIKNTNGGVHVKGIQKMWKRIYLHYSKWSETFFFFSTRGFEAFSLQEEEQHQRCKHIESNQIQQNDAAHRVKRKNDLPDS